MLTQLHTLISMSTFHQQFEFKGHSSWLTFCTIFLYLFRAIFFIVWQVTIRLPHGSCWKLAKWWSHFPKTQIYITKNVFVTCSSSPQNRQPPILKYNFILEQNINKQCFYKRSTNWVLHTKLAFSLICFFFSRANQIREPCIMT